MTIYDKREDVVLNSHARDGREKKEAELLNWRPGKFSKNVPPDVYEARMKLLDPEDREAIERACGDKNFKEAYFSAGKGGHADDWKTVAVGCAAFSRGDADKALRMFKASAAFDSERYNDGTIVVNAQGQRVAYDAGMKYKKFMSSLIDYTKQLEAVDQHIAENKAALAKDSFALSR